MKRPVFCVALAYALGEVIGLYTRTVGEIGIVSAMLVCVGIFVRKKNREKRMRSGTGNWSWNAWRFFAYSAGSTGKAGYPAGKRLRYYNLCNGRGDAGAACHLCRDSD